MSSSSATEHAGTTLDFSLIEPTFTAVPAYRVRVSPRVRQARLSVDVYGEVEVVVPPRFDPRGIPAFVAAHVDWLRSTLQRTQVQGLDPALGRMRPAHVHLRAVGQVWQVAYRDGAGAASCRVSGARALTVQAPPGDDSAPALALQRWLQARGQAYLPEWLARVATETGLRYRKAQVRGQKTKWGSCSSRGVISLNRSLLFLDPALVRYLLVHELCHTVHLDHSRRYWALVARHEPGYRALDQALHRAQAEVPRWAVWRA